jgi:flagellar assembly protein FliH
MSSSDVIKIASAFRSFRVQGFDSPNLLQDNERQLMDQYSSRTMVPLVDERAVHNAFQQGIEEGHRRATELMKAEYHDRVEEERKQIQALFQTIEQRLIGLTPAVEKALLTFTLGVAEHVIRQEVRISPEIVLNVIKDGIKNILGVETIKIRVHPSNVQLVQEHKHAIESVSASLREIIFEADEHVEQGGCIIESDLGNVDARIITQIEQVNSIINQQQ